MSTNDDIPRCLSIRQPWAWLIVNGYKDIENRSWDTDYRGPFLIHAGWIFDENGYHRIQQDSRIPLPEQDQFERGGLVGIVRLTGVVQSSESSWFEGPFGFVLENPIQLPFMPCRGRPGFFRLPALSDEHMRQIRDTLAE